MKNEKKLCEKKKQNVQEAGWATAHLPVLGHDTGNCIVTQGWGGRPGSATGGVTRPVWRAAGHYDRALGARDTTLGARHTTRGRSCISTWFSVSRREGGDTVGPDATTRRTSSRVRTATRQGDVGGAATRRGPARSRSPTTRHPGATTRSMQACDTTMIRPGRGHDTAQHSPRYCPTRATTRRCEHGLSVVCA